MTAPNTPRIGVVGLGRMGGGLARRALRHGVHVVGSSPEGPSRSLMQLGLEAATDLADLARRLPPPRVVLLYVPGGAVVDEVLEGLTPYLAESDVVADGGNSYWGDSRRRAARLAERGIEFVDLGTSGGLGAEEAGFCFMGGARPEAWSRLEPALGRVCAPGGLVRVGPPGTGHYAKLVHNGVEFGMLQSIGEGFALLQAQADDLDVDAVLHAWTRGSVIRGWLIELLAEAAGRRDVATRTSAHVEDTGEVAWLVADALEMEVPVPAISGSVQQLLASRDRDHHAWKAIARMRRGFGGHPIGPDEAVARERRTARRGPIVRERRPFAGAAP